MKSWACFAFGLILCLPAVPQAQARCGSEVKLLLSPDQLQSALTKLNAKRETAEQVYLFDTNTLELLSQGVIVRLRQGARADLMVKVRIPVESESGIKQSSSDYYKCEVDVTADQALRSYSILTSFAGRPPASGTEIFELLSPAQRRLLQEAHVSLDWGQVRRAADIQSSSWQIRGQPTFPKLTLELWEWATGTALELSTKLADDDGSLALVQLQQLLARKGLALNPTQKVKTALVLGKPPDTPAR